jgi:RNA polymerase sigma-70 factor (ECF subfamily)
LEDLTSEQLHQLGAQTQLTPEEAYERNWALALLEQARRELREQYVAAGKLARFASLEPFLPGDRQELTYAQAGASLGLSEEAIKSEVHRMKRRFREVVRTLIAHSVETPEEIDDEVRHLFTALAG